MLRSVELIKSWHDWVIDSLAAEQSDNSLIARFDFPESVRVACEQYLLYFGDFLRDLGVTADTELKHEAGRVLFSVTPHDRSHALMHVREALDVYLALPNKPLMEYETAQIEVDRLKAQIYHFKSQMKLAAAVSRAQEAIIQAHEVTIESQRQMLGDETDPRPGQSRADLLGGAVTITKYQGKGFEIDLPKIFRHLRRLFRKK